MPAGPSHSELRGALKNSNLHRHRLLFPRHVRDGRHVLWPGDADLEPSFQSRLVEARESASRVRRLELSSGDPSVTQNRGELSKQTLAKPCPYFQGGRFELVPRCCYRRLESRDIRSFSTDARRDDVAYSGPRSTPPRSTLALPTKTPVFEIEVFVEILEGRFKANITWKWEHFIKFRLRFSRILHFPLIHFNVVFYIVVSA